MIVGWGANNACNSSPVGPTHTASTETVSPSRSGAEPLEFKSPAAVEQTTKDSIQQDMITVDQHYQTIAYEHYPDLNQTLPIH